MLLNRGDMLLGAVTVVAVARLVAPAVLRMLLVRLVHELGAPGLGKDARGRDLRATILPRHQEHRLETPLTREVAVQALIGLAVDVDHRVLRYLRAQPEAAHHGTRNRLAPRFPLIHVVGLYPLHAANLGVQDQLLTHRHPALVRQLLGVACASPHELRRIEMRAHEGADGKRASPCPRPALVHANDVGSLRLLERARCDPKRRARPT